MLEDGLASCSHCPLDTPWSVWGHCYCALIGFLPVFYRPYFELKAKYYMQLEVRVAFGFEADRSFLPSKPPFCSGLSNGPMAASEGDTFLTKSSAFRVVLPRP